LRTAIPATGWPFPPEFLASEALLPTADKYIKSKEVIAMAKKTRKISVKKNSNYLGTLLG
jgi:hypothetical protein